ncbi:unnamed protein product, partial [Rotaria socialis]
MKEHRWMIFNMEHMLRPEQIRWSKEAQQYSLSVFNQPHSKDIN